MNEYDNHCNKTILVVGGGISGLMTAWILLDKGYRVSIVAKEWATLEKASEQGRITSQVAGALWEYPPGGCGLSEIEVPVLAYSKLDQYRIWALQSFLFYEALAKHSAVDEVFGVTIKNLYQFFYHDLNEPCTDRTIGQRKASKSTRKTGKIDVNATALKWAYCHQAPVIDTDVAIEQLRAIVEGKGAILETRTIEGDLHLHVRELMDDFKADLIVFPVRGAVKRISLDAENVKAVSKNSTVKADDQDPTAKADSQDSTVKALKDSDLEILKANAWLVPAQYHTDGSPRKTIFIVPRNDETLIVRSIIQRNNWDLVSLTAESPEFLGCLDDFTEKVEPTVGRFARGLRPFSHSNVRVAADNRTTSCRVVPNYGHGGSG
ncbi:hypothetical protein BJX68DRAFT_259403 [Aspergillus pseudodeflectus]|uniref:FAD dependent oxidoreductase domain-containing protein n=1 Tax=Aspergillus pseudodeflectus TaxID=176178 RepID=A0ABR4JD77_9EURO